MNVLVLLLYKSVLQETKIKYIYYVLLSCEVSSLYFLNLYCPKRPYVVLKKYTGERCSMPYTCLCVFAW